MGIITKICPVCDKRFTARCGSQRFCSTDCLTKHRQENFKKSKKKSNMDKITLLNIEALEHGTSYGKYVAQKEYPNKIRR